MKTELHPVSMIMSHPDQSSTSPHMSDDKGAGITHDIRTKLGFHDAHLWKRFSARRLELIDDYDLSSKKASEQEREIGKVAEILRSEFHFDTSHCADFEKLVRAAVQSVRRNRKRCSQKSAKRRRVHDSASGPEPEIKVRSTDDTRFLSEISNLNSDHQGSVYDMSYSTNRIVSDIDRSRAAIDSIIRPAIMSRKSSSSLSSGIQLPPLSNINLAPRNAEDGKTLASLKNSLLWLMKKSKSCLSSASSHKNETFRNIGSASILAVNALMLEISFSELTGTSVDYLRDRIQGSEFQARFYRSLDPECPVSSSLNKNTAVTTLHTLVGCCVMDFGFDSVLNLIGEAFYLLILQEFPLISRTSVPFRRSGADALRITPNFQNNSLSGQPVSLSNLAAVASELRNHGTGEISHPNSTPPFALGSMPHNLIKPDNESMSGSKTNDLDKKQVKIRFLSSSLNFEYATQNTAPPRFVEIVDNAKQAFKLNDNQVYGIRNCKSHALVNTDVDLEQIFANEQQIELEVFTQQFSKVPLSELTSVNTPSTQTFEERKPVLPAPSRHTISPILFSPVDRANIPGNTRVPLLPRFQPLL